MSHDISENLITPETNLYMYLYFYCIFVVRLTIFLEWFLLAFPDGALDIRKQIKKLLRMLGTFVFEPNILIHSWQVGYGKIYIIDQKT